MALRPVNVDRGWRAQMPHTLFNGNTSCCNQRCIPMTVVEIRRPSGAEPRMPAALRARIEREFAARWREQWGGKFILHGRPPRPGAVRLDGNDYLSVSGHPTIVNAQVNALREDTEAVVQSGVFLLDHHPARAFEKAMAAWLGKEDTFLCQSGYAAN